VDTLVADADATEAILEEAQREPGTLVVMSTHGRGGLGRLVFGSVAQAVLERSHVPLLLIRVGDQASDAEEPPHNCGTGAMRKLWRCG
jgi:nucleotide-binding universal stress UspA family protein